MFCRVVLPSVLGVFTLTVLPLGSGVSVLIVVFYSGFGFCVGLRRALCMGGTYQQGWDDCLDAVTSILSQVESLVEAKKKVGQVQVLVKAKKFEQIKTELGVIGDLF